MNQPSLKSGALIGGLTSLPVMALFYLGEQLANLPFVPFDLFDWLARVLPGDLIVWVIQIIVGFISLFNLGETSQAAKIIEQLMALGQFVLIGALLGSSIVWLIPYSNQSRRQNGLLAGAVLFFLALLIVLQLSNPGLLGVVWLAVMFGGWGIFIGSILPTQPATGISDKDRAARRAMLIKLAGGSAGLAIGAWGLGRLLDSRPEGIGAGQPLAASETSPMPTPAASTTNPASAATTRDHISPASGTRDELTSNENFYRIDINTRPPVIQEANWELKIEGLFNNPRSLTLEDLMSYPAVTQPVTMGCISNRVGGDLIGTSNWTGVRLRDVLADLGIQDGAKYLKVEAVDSFYETVSMMDMFDPRTLLVYGMNGETLPVEHGFPLRIFIPDRYGMKQPKWITRITALAEDEDGYWVIRGWSKEARPQIVSVIDAVNVEEPTAEGLIPIGGIAWAGDRGISKVELQFDDGQWVEAMLRTPPLSPLTWVQWRYDWMASSGSYSVRVRATDGTGTLQIEESQGTRPDGATGYHSKRVRV